MKTALIVVADSSCARIFTAASASSPLVEIKTMTHPESRLHARDITSDLPGKAVGNGGSGGHAYQQETDPKKYEAIEFARQVAAYLDAENKTNKISKLLLVAAPAFLGELRGHLSSETDKQLVFELNKNLTHQSAEEIRKHLPKFLSH